MSRTRTKKIQSAITCDVVKRVREVMTNRHRLLAPFPLDPIELYRTLWTEDEWGALQVLSSSTELFNTRNFFYIIGCKSEVLSGRRTITIQMDKPLPYDGRSLTFDTLDAHAQAAICAWARLWIEYNTDTLDIEFRVKSIAEICTTYGHVQRLWPELVSFLPEEGRLALERKKIASRYPAEAYMSGHVRILRPEYRPEAFERFSTLLSEAVMLPISKQTRHIAVVS